MSPCSSRTARPSFRSMAGNRITASTSENSRSARGRAAGFFRMKLCADHIVTANDGRERAAVVGLRDQVGALLRLELVGVHEIAVQSLRPERDAVEQRMRAELVERVPAHVR